MGNEASWHLLFSFGSPLCLHVDLLAKVTVLGTLTQEQVPGDVGHTSK